MKIWKKKKKEESEYSTGFWWFFLLLSTLVSVTLNLWHALMMEGDKALVADACRISAALCEKANSVAYRVEGLHPVLGIIFAIVPPAFAAGLSHGLVSPLVGKWIRAAILGLFGLSMATSVISQASVMSPYGGGYMAQWSIPVILDATALISLYIITKAALLAHDVERLAAIEAERAAIRVDIYHEVVGDIRADMKRAFEVDMSAREVDIRADERRTLEVDMSAREVDIRADERRTLSRTFEADMSAREVDIRADERRTVEVEMSTRLEAVTVDMKARHEAEMSTRLEELEARLRAENEVELAAQIRRGIAAKSSPRGRTATPGSRSATVKQTDSTRALSTADKVLVLLQKDPNMTIEALAMSLDVNEKTIRRAKDRLAEEGRLPIPALGKQPHLKAV